MWLAVESASFNWGTACTWLLGLLSSLKYILFVLQINLCTQKKMCLLCIYLSLISGFSPWRRISHKFAFVYLLTGCSSRPFSFENICSLSWWYCWHSSKKCFTVSVGSPHLQAGVIDKPMGCKWQFKYDLFSLSWACNLDPSLKPHLKCFGMKGL